MTEFVVEQVSYGMCPSMSEGMPHSHTKKCCMYAYTQRGVCCTYTMRCCRSMHTKRRPLHIVHKEVLPARTHKETFVAHRTQRCCRSMHTKRRLLHIHKEVLPVHTYKEAFVAHRTQRCCRSIHTKRRLLHIVHKGVAGPYTQKGVCCTSYTKVFSYTQRGVCCTSYTKVLPVHTHTHARTHAHTHAHKSSIYIYKKLFLQRRAKEEKRQRVLVRVSSQRKDGNTGLFFHL